MMRFQINPHLRALHSETREPLPKTFLLTAGTHSGYLESKGTIVGSKT